MHELEKVVLHWVILKIGVQTLFRTVQILQDNRQQYQDTAEQTTLMNIYSMQAATKYQHQMQNPVTLPFMTLTAIIRLTMWKLFTQFQEVL